MQVNRYSSTFRPAVREKKHLGLGLTLSKAHPRMRPAQPSFAGSTTGDFNPLDLLRGASTHAPRSTVFHRLYGWGFQPALRSYRAHPRMHPCPLSLLRGAKHPTQPCFAGSTAGDFNPLGLLQGTSTHAPRSTVFRRLYDWGFQPALRSSGAHPRMRPCPLNRLSPALRLGISTRSIFCQAHPRMHPAQPCFAGSTAGDFNQH